MQDLLKTAGIGGFVGGAVVAVVASVLPFFGGNGADSRAIEPATIYLDRVGDQCHINTVPQTLPARKRQTIEWTILDRCGVTQKSDVELIFRDYDPLEVTCSKTGKKKIKCKIKGDAPVGSYKYDVTAGTDLREDPELEIVQ